MSVRFHKRPDGIVLVSIKLGARIEHVRLLTKGAAGDCAQLHYRTIWCACAESTAHPTIQ